MHVLTHVREALQNLVYSKLRSFLAILGILVGTGSVVALISSSELATQHALSQFKTLGTNLLAMDLQSSQQGGSQSQGASQQQFTEADVPILENRVSQVRLIAPYVNLFNPLVFNGKQYQGQILGATRALADIAKISVAKGRFISYLDVGSYYCVIGHKLAENIRKQGFDPMGKQILIGTTYFTIVGILEPWKPNLFIYADIDNGAIIPLGTSYIISKDAQISNVLFRLVKNPNLTRAQANIRKQMSFMLPNLQIQFRNPQQIIDIVAKQRKTFTYLLSSIGGIALLVGGIGVMNIMLVSVVERRREIGIRMAIGAGQFDILMMFLVESIILTVFGGILGIVLGVLVSLGVAEASGWEFGLYVSPIMLGFTVSVMVGILSGFYPALNASRLDPIDSLTEE